MSDGCREEDRSTCAGCHKALECERGGISEELLMALQDALIPRVNHKHMSKHTRKSAARLKVKR